MTQNEQKQDADQAKFVAHLGFGAEFADKPIPEQLQIARSDDAYICGMHPHHPGAVGLVNRLASHIGADMRQMEDQRRQVQCDEQKEINARNIRLQNQMRDRHPVKDYRQLKDEQKGGVL